jgi:hypothetical protein
MLELVSPPGVPRQSSFNILDWQTGICAHIGAKSIFGPLANRDDPLKKRTAPAVHHRGRLKSGNKQHKIYADPAALAICEGRPMSSPDILNAIIKKGPQSRCSSL